MPPSIFLYRRARQAELLHTERVNHFPPVESLARQLACVRSLEDKNRPLCMHFDAQRRTLVTLVE